jgi:hypothetical protein
MRNLTRTLTLTLAPLVTLALGGLVVACTETTVVPPTPLDASSDTDSGDKTDAGKTDSGDKTDSGSDGGKADGGNDGGNDGGPIATTASEFAAKIANAYCTRTATCCTGSNPAFTKATCLIDNSDGYELILTGAFQPGVKQANIVIDPALAAACLAKFDTFPCRNSAVTPSVDQKSLVFTCASAISGKLAPNAKCTHDIECQRGNFCEGAFAPGEGSVPGVRTTDGGFCKPLKAVGDACIATDGVRGNSCSYLGAGENGKTCADGVCVNLLANGVSCVNATNSYNLACASLTCDDGTALCADAIPAYPAVCY